MQAYPGFGLLEMGCVAVIVTLDCRRPGQADSKENVMSKYPMYGEYMMLS